MPLTHLTVARLSVGCHRAMLRRKPVELPFLALTVVVASFCGCGSGAAVSDDWHANLTHGDPHIRLQAVYRAGRDNDDAAVPLLIARLDDDDATVRFAANVALKRITEQDMGFKAYDELPVRREAARKWQEWFEKEQKR